MTYKDTVFLPKTSFSMRGNLTNKEPEILKTWNNLYEDLRKKSKDSKKFILNYGPPYANGHIHIGHALSEILKDIVNKTYQMLGYDAPMVPGWDCHGLPIEWKIEEEYRKKGKKKEDIEPLEFRESCRVFARKWMAIQSEELERLGIIADWKNPYCTMDFETEGLIVEQLGHFLLNGSLYKGLRPTFWSVVEQTALADNEVEYKDIESPSIYVGFPIKGNENTHLVIWTTTPWTIPCNRAISYNDSFEYEKLAINDKKVIVAKDCINRFLKDSNISDYKNLGKVNLENIICRHPFYKQGYDFDVPLLKGDHVTIETGSGLVHTAPAHGLEDFEISKKHNIEIPDLITDNGLYRKTVPYFADDHIYKVAPKVIDLLKETKNLWSEHKITHSYPHSWRSKKPLIYRATSQWFIEIDKSGIRKKAIQEIEKVSWFPKAGRTRIKSMLENRPDWCISRQRFWGTPLAIFIHKDTREVLRDEKVHKNTVSIIKKYGGDAWFTMTNKDFLGNHYDSSKYEKVTDVIDVWFDSGCVHDYVLRKRPELSWPADLYLEGSDQHRGWFQSSLLESVGVIGKAPYKNVLTHGFVLDEKGYKMSKSTGNVVSPQEIIKRYGADIIRQWVVFSDYTGDLRIGADLIKKQEELYRRFRNTIRYLLGAISDFDPEKESINYKDMDKIEQLILHKIYELDVLHKQCIKKFDFQRFYSELHSFCSNDLSSFYFDIRKDTLYCDSIDNEKRKGARTTLNHIFNILIRWLAPVLSFTAEEAWKIYKGNNQSIHAELFLNINEKWSNPRLKNQWQEIKKIRSLVTGALEVARNEKIIGSSLEACVHVYSNYFPVSAQTLNEICITSEILLHDEDAPQNAFVLENLDKMGVIVEKAKGNKCERCWKVFKNINKICNRCKDIVS